MKAFWFGIVFVLVYGLFSMKSQAAEEMQAEYCEGLAGGSQCYYFCRRE